MSIQRVFSLIVTALAVLGLIGSIPLPMSRGYSLGPGFIPLLYSILLIIFAAVMFFSDKSSPIDWKVLFDKFNRKGWIYYILGFEMFFLTWLIGMAPAMLIYGISTQILLKRQSVLWAVIFSFGWVATLYAVFVILLKLPFENGILFY